MIRSVTVKSFKSYKDATLPLAELTVLIGANASGKSNLIEALQLLSWLAGGRRLGDLLSDIKERDISIRGSTTDLTYGGGHDIAFGCTTADEKGEERLELDLILDVGADGMHVVEERLVDHALKTDFPLYRIEEKAAAYSSEIQVAYNNFAKGGKKPRIACIDQQPVFTQLGTPARFENQKSQEIIPRATAELRHDLEAILFLDPVPVRMRGYSFTVEKTLRRDGSNVSAVLNELCKTAEGKKRVLEFVRSLPEQDISDIDFLPTPRNEVMVRLVETFGHQARPTEAALLSDGTLRVLAVAAGLLSVPPGSMVVIEEIDNGVHPSRAESLLASIQRIATERRLRVLLTTHNPALLDAIPLAAVPNIVACYRDPDAGDSRLVRLEELERYPELVAQGRVGQLVTKGILDKFVKTRPSTAAKAEKAQQFLDLLDRPVPEQ